MGSAKAKAESGLILVACVCVCVRVRGEVGEVVVWISIITNGASK